MFGNAICTIYNERVKHESKYEKPQGEIYSSGDDTNDRHENTNINTVSI